MSTADLPPLDGVRVLDLCQVGAGPYCASLLGDFGADVIKVEPLGGEATRRTDSGWAPDHSTVFAGVNRSKRAIGVDMKSEQGRAILASLVAWADVLAVSMRPAVVARLGLSYEQLRETRPELVYLSITAFGEEGPRSDEPGMDLTAQALSGLMDLTGEQDGPPVKVGAAVTDYATSYLGAFAVLTALRARDRDGIGQKISLNLLNTAVGLMPQHVSSYFATGTAPVRFGSGHAGVVPYQVFMTSDKPLIVACLNDKFWPPLCAAIDRADLADDPRYHRNPERVRRRDEVVGIVSAVLATQPAAYWIDRFRSADVPYAPVLDVGEAFADPQLVHNGMTLSLEHPTWGSYTVVNNPVELSRTPAAPHGHSPDVGEHTDEVLVGLGYTPEQIRILRNESAIG
ncbi:MAG: hypothetical protein ABS81_02755 [Pseudonocardia sp. SCN 72-86]|nr:MAG: hypothetical protein ABS81_02755 [Pseudonocardia sp. SCN 72-86]